MIEAACLVSLCHCKDIALVLRCFTQFIKEDEIISDSIDKEEDGASSLTGNYDVYRQLLLVDQVTGRLSLLLHIRIIFPITKIFKTLGRVAKQKRIRKVLRKVQNPSRATNTALEEAYKRWKVHGASITLFSDLKAPARSISSGEMEVRLYVLVTASATFC